MNARTAHAILGLLTVMVLAAGTSPLHAQDDGVPVVSYELTEGSTYQEGCFDPCDCPLLEEQPLDGAFDLVFYPFAGPLWTVAVENVIWYVPGLGHRITGSGTYVRAGSMQSLSLSLSIDGAEPADFTSGWVEGGDLYPRIDVTVSMHQRTCYDVVMHLRAVPAKDARLTLAVDRQQLAWTAMPGEATYDVVRGDLGALRDDGEFATATDECLANDLPATSLAYATEVGPDRGAWFLVRQQGGSYDADPGTQPSSRDPGLLAAGSGCP